MTADTGCKAMGECNAAAPTGQVVEAEELPTEEQLGHIRGQLPTARPAKLIAVPPGLIDAFAKLIDLTARRTLEHPDGVRRGVEIAVLQRGIAVLTDELEREIEADCKRWTEALG